MRVKIQLNIMCAKKIIFGILVPLKELLAIQSLHVIKL